MIELLEQHISKEPMKEGRLNKAREILQLLSLKILQDKKYFSGMAFVGGTALRILYGMRRFSEDMDFSVIDRKKYDFAEILAALTKELALNGLEVEAKPRTVKTVQSAMLKFPGLLKKLGLSSLPDEKLSIKIKADSNPPAGWKTENTVINNVYFISITHFDLASLYATKLHACFFRKYTKGRDFYDLVWYLGRKIKPNYELLNNAIRQTQGVSPNLSDSTIKEFLLNRVAAIDFGAVKKDVERFLEDKGELQLLEKPVVVKAIIDVFG